MADRSFGRSAVCLLLTHSLHSSCVLTAVKLPLILYSLPCISLFFLSRRCTMFIPMDININMCGIFLILNVDSLCTYVRLLKYHTYTLTVLASLLNRSFASLLVPFDTRQFMRCCCCVFRFNLALCFWFCSAAKSLRKMYSQFALARLLWQYTHYTAYTHTYSQASSNHLNFQCAIALTFVFCFGVHTCVYGELWYCIY